MKKWLKIIIWIIGTAIAIISILLISYIIVNKQGVIEPIQVGNTSAKHKILIASQGSDFKEKLVNKFISELKSDSTYLLVLDCTELKAKHAKGWDVYIIVHTMQIHHIPKQTEKFLHVLPNLSKVILVSTSGAGDEQYKNLKVDAISTASIVIAIDPIMKWILPKIEKTLNKRSITQLR